MADVTGGVRDTTTCIVDDIADSVVADPGNGRTEKRAGDHTSGPELRTQQRTFLCPGKNARCPGNDRVSNGWSGEVDTDIACGNPRSLGGTAGLLKFSDPGDHRAGPRQAVPELTQRFTCCGERRSLFLQSCLKL